MVKEVQLAPRLDGGNHVTSIAIILNKPNRDVDERVRNMWPEPHPLQLQEARVDINNGDIVRLSLQDLHQTAESKGVLLDGFTLGNTRFREPNSVYADIYGLQGGHKYSLTIEHPAEKDTPLQLKFK